MTRRRAYSVEHGSLQLRGLVFALMRWHESDNHMTVSFYLSFYLFCLDERLRATSFVLVNPAGIRYETR
jgi:hypothetical protein